MLITLSCTHLMERKKIRKIVVKDDQGKQLLNDPRRIVVNGEYFSVMNFGSNVVKFDVDGKVLWVYDGPPGQTGTLDAYGMCADKFCNLLISDAYKDRVHYVSSAGSLIQMLLTREHNGIRWPLGICVDEAGIVWMGSGGKKFNVWVYKYLQT